MMATEKLHDAEQNTKFIERLIILGLIVCTEFLKKVRGQWLDNKFKMISPELHKIAGWCFAHYDEYKEAPDWVIVRIFLRHASDDPIEEAEAELIEIILQKLKDDWLQTNKVYNVDFWYKETMGYLDKIAVYTLKEAVEDEPELDKIKSLVGEFKPPGQSTNWQRASEIRPEPTYWHWDNVIPRGEFDIDRWQLFYGQVADNNRGGSYHLDW
jgi:hypothetical protein